MGRHDDFFELGGDSLLGIQVHAQARARGHEFALQDLFSHVTIEALAAAIDGARASASGQ